MEVSFFQANKKSNKFPTARSLQTYFSSTPEFFGEPIRNKCGFTAYPPPQIHWVAGKKNQPAWHVITPSTSQASMLPPHRTTIFGEAPQVIQGWHTHTSPG